MSTLRPNSVGVLILPFLIGRAPGSKILTILSFKFKLPLLTSSVCSITLSVIWIVSDSSLISFWALPLIFVSAACLALARTSLASATVCLAISAIWPVISRISSNFSSVRRFVILTIARIFFLMLLPRLRILPAASLVTSASLLTVRVMTRTQSPRRSASVG